MVFTGRFRCSVGMSTFTSLPLVSMQGGSVGVGVIVGVGAAVGGRVAVGGGTAVEVAAAGCAGAVTWQPETMISRQNNAATVENQ